MFHNNLSAFWVLKNTDASYPDWFNLVTFSHHLILNPLFKNQFQLLFVPLFALNYTITSVDLFEKQEMGSLVISPGKENNNNLVLLLAFHVQSQFGWKHTHTIKQLVKSALTVSLFNSLAAVWLFSAPVSGLLIRIGMVQCSSGLSWLQKQFYRNRKMTARSVMYMGIMRNFKLSLRKTRYNS